MTSQYSSRTADKFVVRLPDGVRDEVTELARTHHQSMNSRIICYIEEGIKRDRADSVRAKDAVPVSASGKQNSLFVSTPPFTIGGSTFVGVETDMSQPAILEVTYQGHVKAPEKVILVTPNGDAVFAMSLQDYATLIKGE